jgi:hypothetical protein
MSTQIDRPTINQSLRILLLVLPGLLSVCCSSSMLTMDDGLFSAEIRPTSLARLIAANDYLISSSRLDDSSFAYLFDSVRNAAGGHTIRKLNPYAPAPDFSIHLARTDSVQIAYFDVRNTPVGVPLRLYLEEGDYQFTLVNSGNRLASTIASAQ